MSAVPYIAEPLASRAYEGLIRLTPAVQDAIIRVINSLGAAGSLIPAEEQLMLVNRYWDEVNELTRERMPDEPEDEESDEESDEEENIPCHACGAPADTPCDEATCSYRIGLRRQAELASAYVFRITQTPHGYTCLWYNAIEDQEKEMEAFDDDFTCTFRTRHGSHLSVFLRPNKTIWASIWFGEDGPAEQDVRSVLSPLSTFSSAEPSVSG